jgi:hypothetical protein
MPSCAKDILDIATDGRFRPETRGKRIGLTLGLNNDELDALEQAFIEQHEWTKNRLRDEPEPEEPSDAAIALLEKRSKDWMREEDTDMTGMLRLILASPLFDISRQEKRLITSKIEKIHDVLDEHAEED